MVAEREAFPGPRKRSGRLLRQTINDEICLFISVERHDTSLDTVLAQIF